MPRPPSAHVEQVRQRLLTRLRDGLHQPGDRFMSNRAIAAQFGVSYQTADRLVRELCDRGMLVRHPGSGTYLPGSTATYAGVQLLFHRRARRRDSFGARLLAELSTRLDRERVAFKVQHVAPEARAAPRISPEVLPVLWEAPVALRWLAANQRPALLLNDRPPPGLAALVIDSVSVDDFAGGACAAQLLTRRGARRLAVLAGPENDARSAARVRGFRSVVACATVVHSPTWFRDDGRPLVPRVLKHGSDGVFCCNDRLAEAVLLWCSHHGRTPPPLVGFDDAPIAERLDLTTIPIPWGELVQVAVGVIKRRLAGDRAPALRQVLAPSVTVRGSLRGHVRG